MPDLRRSVSDMLAPHFRAPDGEMSVGAGWLLLVRQCHDEVVAAFPDYELLCVKQKYGALAFQAFPRPWRRDGAWTTQESRRLDEITYRYEQLSEQTCERCGAAAQPSLVQSVVWTLCDACAKDLP